MTALLSTLDLQVSIQHHLLVKGLDLQIESGQRWAILGRNGIGKSTLLHHLAGLTTADRGTVRVEGEDLASLSPRQRAQRVAVLLQHSDTGLNSTVLETVLTGRHPYLRGFAWESAEDLSIAEAALHSLQLTALRDRPLDRLSGGERRRVEIARLLAQTTALNLLDEPLQYLDMAQQAACLRILTTHCATTRRALVMVLHDLDIAYRYCTHWLLLAGNGEWQSGTRESNSDAKSLSYVFDHPIYRIETADGPVFRPATMPT